jgi:hypothetical protein
VPRDESQTCTRGSEGFGRGIKPPAWAMYTVGKAARRISNVHKEVGGGRNMD